MKIVKYIKEAVGKAKGGKYVAEQGAIKKLEYEYPDLKLEQEANELLLKIKETFVLIFNDFAELLSISIPLNLAMEAEDLDELDRRKVKSAGNNSILARIKINLKAINDWLIELNRIKSKGLRYDIEALNKTIRLIDKGIVFINEYLKGEEWFNEPQPEGSSYDIQISYKDLQEKVKEYFDFVNDIHKVNLGIGIIDLPQIENLITNQNAK